ncbi:carboxy methyl transferase for protein phosphatase 2A [Tulasnella sp. 424]|nr:carboxy methyl transferase for protein phosphatase 2A [Tulasnella sp. 424]KAG8970755.1 carboxy methyl transferase for protein phosphatase 2A [Tulasnella sp. 425]
MLPPPPPRAFPDGDAAIRSTDDDAAHARVSAVRKGYLKDPYIQYLVPRSHLIPTRPPLINLGTFIRSEVIDRLVIKWLDLLGESSKAQIDLAVNQRISKYVEIDFPEVVTKKLLSIRKHSTLGQAVGPDITIERGGTVLRSGVFNVQAADLRGEPSTALQPLETLLLTEQPVLLLAECVFPYMSPETSSAVIRWFCERYAQVSIISYDMFGLGDAFGKVMRENLKIRNIELPGVDDDSTRQSLERRLHDSGFSTAASITLKNARVSCFTDSELERLSGLEMLDEMEELELVLGHYVISWGSTDEDGPLTQWKLTSS